MTEITDIKSFIANELGIHQDVISSDTDIYDTFGTEGDDCFDFEAKYAERFDVNMDNFRWYFHHGEEGWNIGALIFKPPHGRVDRIPITPALLQTYAKLKSWQLSYPKHTLPKRRYDLMITRLLVILVIAGSCVATWE